MGDLINKIATEIKESVLAPRLAPSDSARAAAVRCRRRRAAARSLARSLASLTPARSPCAAARSASALHWKDEERGDVSPFFNLDKSQVLQVRSPGRRRQGPAHSGQAGAAAAAAPLPGVACPRC